MNSENPVLSTAKATVTMRALRQQQRQQHSTSLGQQHRGPAGRCCRQRPAVTSRRTSFSPIAFRLGPALAPTDEQEEQQQQAGGPTVLLPLDLYSCLKVTRTAGSRAVRDALDRALLNRPEAYYSSDTVALRDLLLRTAADNLLNYDKRREYDAKAQGADGYVVRVSEDHLPGALVLLQDSGAHQLVLDLGAKWLADNRNDSRRRDTAAAMALAHRALALQGLQREGGSVLDACRHLEAAVRLSRESLRGSEQASAVADLQREALQLLKDYSPEYCLALLGLPLGDAQRPRGHALLRKLLHQLPDELSPLGPAGPDDLLAAARSLLTPQEHVELLTSIPSGSRTIMQQQLLAEALVAVAFLAKQPLLIVQAAGSFKQLEKAAAQEGGGADTCVERACIAVLLGSTDQAVQELGLGPDGQQQPEGSPAQEAAREYVQAHCRDSSDLLPGLYSLAECWVQQGILSTFRQDGSKAQAAQQEAVDLATWFDSPGVRLAIMVLTLLARVKQLVLSVAELPAAAVAGLLWLQQRGSQAASAAASKAAMRQAAISRSTQPPASASSSRVERAAAGVQQANRPTPAGQSTAVAAGPSLRQELKQQQQRCGGQQQQRATQPQQQPQVKLAASEAGVSTQRLRTPVRDDAAEQSVAVAAAAAAAATGPSIVPHAATTSPSAAAAADDGDEARTVEEASPLVARARAAAAAKRGAGRAGLDEGEEDEGPAALPGVRERLEAEMAALEAQMWDVAPDSPSVWRPAAALRPLVPVVLLGAVLLWGASAGNSSNRQPVAGQGPATLLIDSRG